MSRAQSLIYSLFAFAILIACKKDTIQYQSDLCMNTNWTYDDFTIVSLNGNDHPYNPMWSVPPVTTAYLFDSLGVPALKLNGVNYYHPVHMSQYAFKRLDWFSVSGDSANLQTALEVVARMKKVAVSVDSSVLFRNFYDFKVHRSPNEVMEAGWVSAMGQGQALSLFCWMYEHTSDPNLLIWADKIYNSFHRFKGDGISAWISCVDGNGNLWLEEYPSEVPCFTLNGKIYALIGLYDYYILTGNEEAKRMLMASITTIKANVHRYRRSGQASLYCVKHNKSYNDYHQTHINLLRTLNKMTGDPFFEEMASTFEEDFQE
ncbi:MAG: D-glucuronyl C5-epimerase family protein [Crocinitomicaceae bacterium]|nr:D-glucuronyl C5-epimerase family protein [Crocinitomicaceae bacterium]